MVNNWFRFITKSNNIIKIAILFKGENLNLMNFSNNLFCGNRNKNVTKNRTISNKAKNHQKYK